MIMCLCVCHEKSSFSSSELSAGGAKRAVGWLWPSYDYEDYHYDDDDDGDDYHDHVYDDYHTLFSTGSLNQAESFFLW